MPKKENKSKTLEKIGDHKIELIGEDQLFDIINDKERLEKVMAEDKELFLLSLFDALRNSEDFREKVKGSIKNIKK